VDLREVVASDSRRALQIGRILSEGGALAVLEREEEDFWGMVETHWVQYTMLLSGEVSRS